MFEDFPDSDSDATDVKVFEEHTEDAAAIADVEGKEVDKMMFELSYVKATKVMNCLNDLFLKNCIQFELADY